MENNKTINPVSNSTEADQLNDIQLDSIVGGRKPAEPPDKPAAPPE